MLAVAGCSLALAGCVVYPVPVASDPAYGTDYVAAPAYGYYGQPAASRYAPAPPYAPAPYYAPGAYYALGQAPAYRYVPPPRRPPPPVVYRPGLPGVYYPVPGCRQGRLFRDDQVHRFNC